MFYIYFLLGILCIVGLMLLGFVGLILMDERKFKREREDIVKVQAIMKKYEHFVSLKKKKDEGSSVNWRG